MNEEIRPMVNSGITDLEEMLTRLQAPLVILNPQNRVLFSNPACSEQFSLAKDDRVILQIDPMANRQVLILPFKNEKALDRVEVFSASDIEWEGNPAKLVLLDQYASDSISELLERKRVLQTLISNLPGMSYRCKLGSPWVLTYASGQCTELTGYSPDDLVHTHAHSYGNLILPEDRQRVWDSVNTAAAENRPYQLTYRIQPRKGPKKWVWEQGRTVYGEDGKPAALEGLIFDMTPWQEAVEALNRSEAHYQSLFLNLPEAVCLTDATGLIIQYNQAFEELLSGESLKGVRFQDFLGAEDRQELQRRVLQAKQMHQSALDIETTFIFKNNSVPVRCVIGFTFPSSQNAGGFVIEVQNFRDLQIEQRQFKEQQAAYETIVENSPMMILRFKPDGEVTYVNSSFCTFYGLERETVLGRKVSEVIPKTSLSKALDLPQGVSLQLEPKQQELFEATSDLDQHWIRWTTRAIVDSDQRFIEYQAVGEDITIEKNAQLLQNESEIRFRELLGNVKLIAIILDLQGRILYCNNYFCDVVGIQMEYVIGMNWLDKFLSIDDAIAFKKLLLECALTGSIPSRRENNILTAQGEQRQISWTNTTLTDSSGNVTGIASIGQDITDRTLSERIQMAIYQISQSANQTRDLEQFYSSIHQILQEFMPVDNFFIALLDREQNLLSFPYFIDQLDARPEPQKPGRGLTEYVLRTGKTVLVNPEVFNLLIEEQEVEEVGSPSVDWLGVPLKVEDRIIGVMGAQSYSEGVRFKYQDEQMMAFVSTQVAMAIDRKRSEQELVRSQKRSELLVEASTDAIFIETLDGRIVDCNSVASSMYGYSREKLCQMTIRDLVPQGVQVLMPEFTGKASENSGIISETVNLRADGSVFPIEISLRLTTIEGDQMMVAYVRDISERKKTELAIIESEAKFRDLAETTAAGIFIHRGENYLYVNPAWCRMTGFNAEELKQLKVTDRISSEQAAELRETTLIHLHGVQEVDQYELKFENKQGEYKWFDVNSGLINFEGATAVIGTAVDVTARKQRENEMEVIAQISELLRSTTTMADIPPAILGKLPELLNVDGAIMCTIVNSDQESLVIYGTGSWKVLEGIRLPRDKGLAGIIIQTGKPYVSHSPVTDPHIEFPELISSMSSIAGAPLIAQGKTTGVLIVGSEHTLGDFELRLLAAVADITANGLQRAWLYDQTLDQTQELLNAYNASLEGWALALELRDKDTQGHSLRIAEMTLRLARRMGIEESQIENMRQGALLHDIGKMGIPDTILLKAGTLSESDWAVMRKHPVYARDMLSQIPFFKGSIDIPYSHHEWWDGSGYPQGLEGEQIPLSARIFAIVDAWDALTSNRPYRKAWGKKEALAHIINQAGTHFDPNVVDAFVKMLQEEGE